MASTSIIVVGGGIVGCSAAYYLAGEGHSVRLIEQESVASHASGFAYGGLAPAAGVADPVDALTALSGRLHSELSETLFEESGVDPEYRSLPSVLLATSESEAATMRAVAETPHSDGARWLSPDDLRRFEPRVSPSVPGGLSIDGYRDVEPYKLTLALWQAAEQRGARLSNATVTGVLRRSGRMTGVRLRNDTVEADAVVIAAGPWSGDASEWLGTPLPVSPLKGQILRLRAPGPPLAAGLWWASDYAGSKQDGLIYSGTTEEPVGFDENPTSQARDQIMLSLLDMLPSLADAELVKQTACLRPLAPDWLPVIGTIPGVEGVVVATGAGRTGIMIGPAMGRVAADLATGRDPAVDLGAFSPARFA